MTSWFPVIAVGGTLGQRHHHLNSLVAEAHRSGVTLQAVRDEPERSPLDRLFKIQLADKSRHLDYILHNLKDEDMLYVSTALKSKWLLEYEYCYIINPSYLEDTLYPEMTTTAVNKMKHWIYLNLNDSERCEEFYEYYVKTFDAAIKFLPNCSNEFILSKAQGVLDKLTPHYLKVLCEKCPEVAIMYFEGVQSDSAVSSKYLKHTMDKKYYNSVKCVLKLNADIFLDITEKYFNNSNFDRFSSAATRYIIQNHKNRFNNKPELYAAWLLDMKTLGPCLNQDEIKEIVLKLARAEYLGSWFSYKSVEPLIKSLSIEDRTHIKKQIFVDKCIGDKVMNWPYDPPSPPVTTYPLLNVFQDLEHDPLEYEDPDIINFRSGKTLKRRIKKRKFGRHDIYSVEQSGLDKLFNRYRFAGFEQVLSDLKKKMLVENMQNRQNMMLVLVSKTGGRPESIEELLKLLISCHANEPMHMRATIIRSLVKRSCVWRLPEITWNLLLKFGRDLGLDGKPTSADCIEGLHAVVIRSLLLGKCESDVWNEYLEQFSTLTEYSLLPAERKIIAIKLPALLISEANANPKQAVHRLNQVLDTLVAYKIPIDRCAGVVSAIAAAANKDSDAEWLLHRLFAAKVARKQLFRENFKIIQTDVSYINALKHDITILATGKEFETVIESNELKHDRFLRALTLYFNEENGLAQKYLEVLERKAAISHKRNLSRSLAYLIGAKFIPMIQLLDASPKGSHSKRIATDLRANAHLTRPFVNLDVSNWQFLGAKATANKVLICSELMVGRYMQALLSQRRTTKIAFVLSMRVGKEYSVFETIAAKRPKFALKTILFHLRRGKALDQRVWDIIVELISKLDLSGKLDDRLHTAVGKVDIVRPNIKTKYCTMMYDIYTKSSMNKAAFMLGHLEQLLPEVEEEFIERIMKHIIQEELKVEKMSENNYYYDSCVCLYGRIITKYLLLSKSEIALTKRLDNIGEMFLAKMEELWRDIEVKSDLMTYIDDLLLTLKYTKVFLDEEYTSCLPVFERILKWMQGFLPIEHYFDKYVQMHLTMLYFKSVRQSMKNNRDVFEHLPNKYNEAVDIVGTVFGKYIAHEIISLISKYFDSITELYQIELVNYLRTYFQCDRELFVDTLTKAILDNGHDQTDLIAEHLYENICNSDEVLNVLKSKPNQKLQFFLQEYLSCQE